MGKTPEWGVLKTTAFLNLLIWHSIIKIFSILQMQVLQAWILCGDKVGRMPVSGIYKENSLRNGISLFKV